VSVDSGSVGAIDTLESLQAEFEENLSNERCWFVRRNKAIGGLVRGYSAVYQGDYSAIPSSDERDEVENADVEWNTAKARIADVILRLGRLPT
jgi:hypothetical protein